MNYTHRKTSLHFFLFSVGIESLARCWFTDQVEQLFKKGQSKDIGFTVLPDTIDKSKDGKSDLEENKGRTIWPTNTITFGAAKEKPDVAGTVAGFRRFEPSL